VSVQELSLLDGRYQLIRQLSGPARTPLMVASDLQTGKVICVRLQRFTTALANLAAVPLLTAEPQSAGDGPLLPYDFGVDEGTTYLVREFVTATSLQQMLAAPKPHSALDVVSVLRRAGEAMLTASAQGFYHPGLALRHVLIAMDGTVRVSGYDAVRPGRQRGTAGEGAMLAALLTQAFAGRAAAPRLNIDRNGRPFGAAGRHPPADGAQAVYTLLLRNQTWQATTVPDLATVVRELRRCEEQLLGYSRAREALKVTARTLAALFRRFRHLGPLLHPYVVVLALVVAVFVLAARALSTSASPGRLLVYPVPTRAADAPVVGYPFINPPSAAVATAIPKQATVVSKVTTYASPVLPMSSTADAGVAAHVPVTPPAPRAQQAALPPQARQAPSLPATRQQASAAPAPPAAARTVGGTAVPPQDAAPRPAPAAATAMVIVTRLTAQQTTARVTVIGATSTESGSAVAVMSRATSTSVTHSTTASAHPAPTSSVRVIATTAVSKASATPAKSAVTRVIAILH